MNILSLFIHKLSDRIVRYAEYYRLKQLKHQLGHIENDTIFRIPDVCSCPEKIFLYKNTNVYAHAKFIISPKGKDGRFVMKDNSGAAEGLTVITGNHHRLVGILFKELMLTRTEDEDRDVIVEEDVWIGANVTLLSGVKIGRGATVGANSVCFKNVPPYSIVMGNPAKVIGFNYTPEEIIEHEKVLYDENDRLSIEKIQKIFIRNMNMKNNNEQGMSNNKLDDNQNFTPPI